MADGNVQIHPAVERLALRRQMADAVERLLDAVDVLVRHLDADAPDADLEPSLGAPEPLSHIFGIGPGPLRDNICRWSKGASDDREGDGDRLDEGRDADLEPSLGSAPGINQRLWANGGFQDREQEHDGREPSLGSIGGTYNTSWIDQRRWAEGGDQGEREAVCEDEGSFREGDDEPDCDGEGMANPQWQIAGRPMTEVDGPDAWRPIDPDDDPGEVVVRSEAGLF